MRLWYLSHRGQVKARGEPVHPCSLARAFSVRTHEVDEGSPTKNQTSSLHLMADMCV